MKFIFHSLRSSSSQNLPYGCASDFEINRRGDHRSPVLQTRNFFRRIVGQGRFPLQGKCHEVTKGFAESQICSCRKYFNKLQFEKRLERNVQASFGTFRLLLGGSTHVQLPLAKYEIYLTFSKSYAIILRPA